MLKKFYKPIIYLALTIVLVIFVYWYLNYYMLGINDLPDGTEVGYMKETTLTRGSIVLGGIILSFASFILFLYHAATSVIKK